MSVKAIGNKMGKFITYISEESVYWIIPCLLGIIIIWVGITAYYVGFLTARDNGWLANAEEKEAYNQLMNYVEDKDIESVEYLKEDHKYYSKTTGVVVKVVGEEPQTFKPSFIFKKTSHDDKIHIGGDKYNAIIYEPIDYSAKYTSN